MTRILFLVPYPTEGASNRYRVEQYLPYLKKAGIDCTLHPFWNSSAFAILYRPGHRFRKLCYFIRGTASRILDLAGIFRYDAVFIHREAYPIGGTFFESILTKLEKPFIFDFDDAIFLPAPSPNNFIERYKRPQKVASIIKMAKHVIAGNRYLADYALRYNRAVSVIPTPIDIDKYYVNEKRNGEITIGWMGSITTLDFLNALKTVFIKLSGRFPNLKLKIVGGIFHIKGLNIISKHWSLDEEVGDLMSFDIGIMPMSDNKWTKGKCGFKAILYMSAGIPCVCSNIGVNKEIIKDGHNGFLADGEEDWLRKLSLLIESPELREKFGREGRRTVEERFSVEVNAPKILNILKGR